MQTLETPAASTTQYVPASNDSVTEVMRTLVSTVASTFAGMRQSDVKNVGPTVAVASRYPANTAERVAEMVETKAASLLVDERDENGKFYTNERALHAAIDWALHIVNRDRRLSSNDLRDRRRQLEAMRPPREESQYIEQLERALKRGANGEPDALKKTLLWALRTNEKEMRLDTTRKVQIREYIIRKAEEILLASVPNLVAARTEALANVRAWLTEFELAAAPKKPDHQPRRTISASAVERAPAQMITYEAVDADLNRTQDLLGLAKRYLTRVLVPANRQIASADLQTLRQLVRDRVHARFIAQTTGINVLGAISEATNWLDALDERNEKPRYRNDRPRQNGNQPRGEVAAAPAAPRELQYKVTAPRPLNIERPSGGDILVRASLIASIDCHAGTGQEILLRAERELLEEAQEKAKRADRIDAKIAVRAAKQARIERAEESARNSRKLDSSMLYSKDKRAPKAAQASEESGKGRKGGNRGNGKAQGKKGHGSK